MLLRIKVIPFKIVPPLLQQPQILTIKPHQRLLLDHGRVLLLVIANYQLKIATIAVIPLALSSTDECSGFC